MLLYESIIIDMYLSRMIAVYPRELKCNSQQSKKKKEKKSIDCEVYFLLEFYLKLILLLFYRK